MKKKIRILHPIGCRRFGISAAGGDVVEMDEKWADTAIAKGYAEEPAVERATAAPGEKRVTGKKRGRPRKKWQEQS